MLSQMVCALLDAEFLAPGDTLLARALAALRREHSFFLRRRSVRLRAPEEGAVTCTYDMVRYCADWDKPRPESYRSVLLSSEATPRLHRAGPSAYYAVLPSLRYPCQS